MNFNQAAVNLQNCFYLDFYHFSIALQNTLAYADVGFSFWQRLRMLSQHRKLHTMRTSTKSFQICQKISLWDPWWVVVCAFCYDCYANDLIIHFAFDFANISLGWRQRVLNRQENVHNTNCIMTLWFVIKSGVTLLYLYVFSMYSCSQVSAWSWCDKMMISDNVNQSRFTVTFRFWNVVSVLACCFYL